MSARPTAERMTLWVLAERVPERRRSSTRALAHLVFAGCWNSTPAWCRTWPATSFLITTCSLIVNSPIHGGAGTFVGAFSDVPTLTTSAPRTWPHRLHLADEYDYFHSCADAQHHHPGGYLYAGQRHDRYLRIEAKWHALMNHRHPYRLRRIPTARNATRSRAPWSLESLACSKVQPHSCRGIYRPSLILQDADGNGGILRRLPTRDPQDRHHFHRTTTQALSRRSPWTILPIWACCCASHRRARAPSMMPGGWSRHWRSWGSAVCAGCAGASRRQTLPLLGATGRR